MKALLWFIVAIATGVYLAGPIVDPDLWWHITAGRWIIANGEVPRVDHWNMFAIGKPWIAYSWTNEIIFAWVDGAFGDHGLIVLKILLGISLSLSLFYCLGKIAGDWFFGAFLGIIATFACFNHFTLRPQSLVWIYFIWLLYVVNAIAKEGLTRNRGIALVVLMSLWANTHLSTILGVAAVGCWVFNPKDISRTIEVVLLALLGTCITPYLGSEWYIFFAKAGHPFAHRSIAEFGSASFANYSTGFLIVILSILALFTHLRLRMENIWKLFGCGTFVLAGLAVVKFLPFSTIIVAAFLAYIWKEEKDPVESFGNFAEGLVRLKTLISRVDAQGLSFIALVTIIINIHSVWQSPLSAQRVPNHALDFIIEKNLEHPVLNDFGRGGYIMYRFSDERGELKNLVSIDGRTNVNPPEIWEKYIRSEHGHLAWQEYLDLVEPSTIIWRTESPFTTLLIQSDDWCRVFNSGNDEEGGYSVFIRTEQFSQQSEILDVPSCIGYSSELDKEQVA